MQSCSTQAAATCLPIDVTASTTTAGASCAGGSASTSPTCTFECSSGYSLMGESTITCDVFYGESAGWVGGWVGGLVGVRRYT